MNWLNKLLAGGATPADSTWDENAYIVDVRSAAEFASGHVEGALNIPLHVFAQTFASALPDRSRQVVLYCQSGARSGQAAEFLSQQQYTNVVNGRNAASVARQLNRPIR